MIKIKCNELKESVGGVFTFNLADGVIGMTPSTTLKEPVMNRLYARSGRDVNANTFYGFWLHGEDLYIVKDHIDSILNHSGLKFNKREQEKILNADFSPVYDLNYIKINLSWGSHVSRDLGYNRVVHDENPSVWAFCGGKPLHRNSLHILREIADTFCRRLYKIDDSIMKNTPDANWIPYFHEDTYCIYEPREFIERRQKSLKQKYIINPEP